MARGCGGVGYDGGDWGFCCGGGAGHCVWDGVLALALAFTKQYNSQREYMKSSNAVSLEQLRRLIIKRSRGLIEISRPLGRRGNIVQFIHGSVREYLLENSTLLLPHLSNREQVMAIANDELARSCFNLVRVSDPFDYERITENMWYFHPLLMYVARYGFEHAEDAEKAGLPQLHVAEALGLTSTHRTLCNESPGVILQENCFSLPESAGSKWNPLFLCCHRRLVSVIEALSVPAPPVRPNTKCAVQELAETLHAAFNEGEQRVRTALLAKCTSNCDHALNGSPVYNAVINEHYAILGLLLHKGASPNILGDHGTALNLAASNGHEELVHLLLEYGADPGLSDEKYGHPLLTAASKDHRGIVKLLLDYGANVSLRGRYYWGLRALKETHALEEASFWDHEDVLVCLLEAAGQTVLPEEYYREADTAAEHGGHVNCMRLIREAARRRAFHPLSDHPWYQENVPTSLIPSLTARSRGEITVHVRGFTLGRIRSVVVPGHCQGIVLKEVIDNLWQFAASLLVLDSEKGVRRITNEEHICDLGVRDGSRIEVLLPYNANTGGWVDDEYAMERAIRISALDARQQRRGITYQCSRIYNRLFSNNH